MTQIKYAWRDNRAIGNVDPQVAGEEMERIRQDRGAIVPSELVQIAATPDNPLHPCFEWDDSKAAREHRLSQARDLSRSVYVIMDRSGPVEYRPMYVHITRPESREGAYQSLSLVAKNPQQLEELIETLQRRVGSARYQLSVIKTAVATMTGQSATAKKLAKVSKALERVESMAEAL